MTDLERQKVGALIALIAGGEVQALDELARLLSARMLSVARSVLNDKHKAEDAVQDSFIKIIENAKKFRPDTNGYAWICKIVQNTALNILRSDRTRQTLDIDEFFDLADDGDLSDNAASTFTVKNAMSVLSTFERRVIYQKYFMDFTVRDSAKSLNKSKSTIARTITAAEAKMREYIAGQNH